MSTQTWYRLDLGNPADSHCKQQLKQIQTTAQMLLFSKRGEPDWRHAAVFDHYDTLSGIKSIFFTPAFAPLALQLGARACVKPDPNVTHISPMFPLLPATMAYYFPDLPRRS